MLWSNDMTSIESQAKAELEAILDKYWPKNETENRGQALVLFAEAMVQIRKAVKAFGGCTKCYGKGYATQMLSPEAGESIRVCDCDRGNQLLRTVLREQSIE